MSRFLGASAALGLMSMWSCGVGVEAPEGLISVEQAVVAVQATCPAGTVIEPGTCGCVPIVPSCGCAGDAGFSPSFDRSRCERVWAVAPNIPLPYGVRPDAGIIIAGDEDPAYSSRPAFLVSTDSTPAWPFTINTTTSPTTVTNALGAALPLYGQLSPMSSYPVFTDKLKGAERISIRNAELTANWVSKSVCLTVPYERNYTMYVGGDDFYQVSIDGKVFASCTTGSSSNCFGSSGLISQTLTAGDHRVEIRHRNSYAFGKSALWLELYQNSLSQVLAASTPANLKSVFSSRSLRGKTFDYAFSDVSFSACPAGYFFDPCAPWAAARCVRIDTQACTY